MKVFPIPVYVGQRLFARSRYGSFPNPSFWYLCLTVIFCQFTVLSPAPFPVLICYSIPGIFLVPVPGMEVFPILVYVGQRLFARSRYGSFPYPSFRYLYVSLQSAWHSVMGAIQSKFHLTSIFCSRAFTGADKQTLSYIV